MSLSQRDIGTRVPRVVPNSSDPSSWNLDHNSISLHQPA